MPNTGDETLVSSLHASPTPKLNLFLSRVACTCAINNVRAEPPLLRTSLLSSLCLPVSCVVCFCLSSPPVALPPLPVPQHCTFHPAVKITHRQVLPKGGNPAVLPDPCRAVRGPKGGVAALHGQELRRLQRDLLAEGLPRPGRRGPDAGRSQEKVHQDFRGEAVVAGADGEKGDLTRPSPGGIAGNHIFSCSPSAAVKEQQGLALLLISPSSAEDGNIKTAILRGESALS